MVFNSIFNRALFSWQVCVLCAFVEAEMFLQNSRKVRCPFLSNAAGNERLDAGNVYRYEDASGVRIST